MEKGALIEILRKEIGPWWFGRIKKEDASLVEEILDPELGWFPKDFVRVIHSPETDGFFLRHIAEEEQRHKEQQLQQLQVNEQSTTTAIAAAAAADIIDNNNTSSSAPCTPGNTSAEDNCNTTVIDKHNVTTIVIESSSPTAMSLEEQQHRQQQHCIVVSDSNDTIMENHVQHQDGTSSASSHPALTANGQTILSTSQSLNVIMGSADILRRSAVKELLDTEVNYVKLLQAICEG